MRILLTREEKLKRKRAYFKMHYATDKAYHERKRLQTKQWQSDNREFLLNYQKEYRKEWLKDNPDYHKNYYLENKAVYKKKIFRKKEKRICCFVTFLLCLRIITKINAYEKYNKLFEKDNPY